MDLSLHVRNTAYSRNLMNPIILSILTTYPFCTKRSVIRAFVLSSIALFDEINTNHLLAIPSRTIDVSIDPSRIALFTLIYTLRNISHTFINYSSA